jgi:hypothetical protein
MSSGNKVFSRGENPMDTFVRHNVPRANRQSNLRQCRRRMQTEQQSLPANEVALFRANSLVRPLTVLTRKCQTTAIVQRTVERLHHRLTSKWYSPSTNQKALL